MQAANTVTQLQAAYDIYEASAIKQVVKSKTPTLFIHGDQDTFVLFYMMEALYQAASVEKEKLIISGAGHGLSEPVNPELYRDTLWGFVNKYIP